MKRGIVFPARGDECGKFLRLVPGEERTVRRGCSTPQQFLFLTLQQNHAPRRLGKTAGFAVKQCAAA